MLSTLIIIFYYCNTRKASSRLPWPSMVSPAPASSLSVHWHACISGRSSQLRRHSATLSPHRCFQPAIATTHTHSRPRLAPATILAPTTECVSVDDPYSRTTAHSWPWPLLPHACLQPTPTVTHTFIANPSPCLAKDTHHWTWVESLLRTPAVAATDGLSCCTTGSLPQTWSCRTPLHSMSRVQLDLVQQCTLARPSSGTRTPTLQTFLQVKVFLYGSLFMKTGKCDCFFRCTDSSARKQGTPKIRET